MSTLRDIQENFQAYIMDDDERIISQLTDLERMGAKARADVYKRGYALRLLEIMGKDFPVLKEFMGEDAFDRMGREYIKTFPSDHYNIVYYDRHMLAFLENHPGITQVHRELAEFEWLHSQLLIGEDAQQLTIQDLSAISPDDWGFMHLTFHPSVRTLELCSNAPLIWRAKAEEQALPESNVQEEPITWLFWRFELKGYFVSLDKGRAWIYQAIRNDMNFADICEGLAQMMPEEEVGTFAAFTLRDWFMEGVISQVRLEK